MRDDLRYAVRSLLNSRGFTLTSLLVIALGVGTITPIFAIVDHVSLRQLPYPDAERIVVLRDAEIPANSGRLPMALRNFLDWREQPLPLDAVAAVRGADGQVRGADGELEDVAVARVTGEFFDLFGQAPQLGTLITRTDETGERRVAVITDAFWKRSFGGRRDIIGQLLTVDGASHEIVGVTRQGFEYPAGTAQPNAAFVPLTFTPAQRARPRGLPFLMAFGRLKPGVSRDQAQAGMNVTAEALKKTYPDWDAGVALDSYRDLVVGRVGQWMRLLFWGVVLVFMLMCANIASLLLGRANARRREVGVRAALGASRFRIGRQLLFESVLLSVAGTAAGLLIGYWGLEIFRTSIPPSVPRRLEISLDWPLIATGAIAALVTGALFGLAPAIFASKVDLSSSLKAGGAGALSRAGNRLRNALIVGELAVALVLLVGALLFTTSFLRVMSIPLGLDYENVLIGETRWSVDRLTARRPAGPVRARDFFAESNAYHDAMARMVERVRAVPGVIDVAASSARPFSLGRSAFSYELPGKPGFKWTRGEHQMVTMKLVSWNYHSLLRIPLKSGRYLSGTDTRGSEGVIVVSESAARMIWPGEDPIGQLIDLQKVLRVVGVVADVRMDGPESTPWPDVYVPLVQGVGTNANAFLIRTALAADDLRPAILAAIRQIDPSQRMPELVSVESMLDRIVAQRRFNMLVVLSFGTLSVLIAAIGLYGVMAYLVSQRTREIGIRMALGSSRGKVIRLVLGRAAALATAGTAAGAIGVWYFASAVRAFLYQLDPLDARVVGAAIGLMFLTALIAALVPARRAASVDPLIALRQD